MTTPEASWPRIIGSLDDEGADGAVGVVVHVGAADADGVQLDAHVAGAERLLLLDREVAEGELVLLFEDEGLHRGLLRASALADDRDERLHDNATDRGRVSTRFGAWPPIGLGEPAHQTLPPVIAASVQALASRSTPDIATLKAETTVAASVLAAPTLPWKLRRAERPAVDAAHQRQVRPTSTRTGDGPFGVSTASKVSRLDRRS